MRALVRTGATRLLAVVLAVALVSSYTLVVLGDLGEEYTWYYPLNTPRRIALYYPKSEVAVVTVDVEKSTVTPLVTTGLLLEVVVDKCTSCYVAVYSRGVNYYALLVLLVNAVTYVAVAWVTRRSGKTRVLALTASWVLATSVVPLTWLYVNLGSNLGYNVVARSVDLPVENPVDLYSLLGGEVDPSLRQVLYTYRYGVVYSDEVNTTTLVSVSVESASLLVPLAVTRGEQGENRVYTVTGAQSISFYVERGSLRLLVLSVTPTLNTTLVYREHVFTEKRGEYSAVFAATALAALTVIHVTTIPALTLLATRRERTREPS